jgi:hypothetical protein
MDKKDYVQQVALKSYEASKAEPNSFYKLRSAVEAMNTVPEYVALDRLGYTSLPRKQIDAESERVRQQYPEFVAINEGAVTLKHVRRHVGGKVIASSTGVSPDDPTTWVFSDGSTSRSYRDVLDQAAAVLPTIPELKSTNA